MNTELMENLEEIALKMTKPFCHLCYEIVPNGVCPHCQSDDLMRHLDGVGVEYGTKWVVHHLVESELEAIEFDSQYELLIEEIYGETVTVGYMDLRTVEVMKEQDLISWENGLYEYISNLEEEGEIISFDNGTNYYYVSDIENLISKHEDVA